MENDQSLALCDENNENLDIYPELNSYLSGALPVSFQSTTTTSDVEMQEATELVSDDKRPSEYCNSEMAELVHHSVSAGSFVADPQLQFPASSHRYSQHAQTDENRFERPTEKSAATINKEDYVYVRTLMPVAPKDLSKIEQIGKGKVKFIDDEHVMIYASFLNHAKIIRSDTQKEMDLSFSEKKEIYFRDGGLFLPRDSGKEIKVETCPFERPLERSVTAINEEDYIYVRTLTPVAPEDISKIEVGKGKVKFIADEHVMTYGRFLGKAKIIRSDTQAVMDLSYVEKKKIYYRDGQLCLMVSGKEIKVETRPFARPAEKSAAAINKEDYVYVRTLTTVAQADISKIEIIGKAKFIGDGHVMSYEVFLKNVKIIRSDTQEKMDLSSAEKQKIYSRDGRLFLRMDSGEEIKVETCPVKRLDKKRRHEDITKQDQPEDAAPAAKRKKIGEKAASTTVSKNRNSLFRTKPNVGGDENGDTEDEGDYSVVRPGRSRTSGYHG